jgi:hypothetical protein
MSIKPYIPTAVFDTPEEIIQQYKKIYADANPQQVIAAWLDHCFAETNVTIPSYATKDYQIVLNFIYSYRGSFHTFGSYR